MSEPQEQEGRLENLEHEAAGFMNPFKWGKKKKEEEEAKKAEEAKAQAEAQAKAAPPITEPAAAAPPPAAAPPAAAPAPPAAPAAPAATAAPKATPKPGPPPPKAVERAYKVKAGDTLWDIATQYYGDGRQYMKIAKANNIADPNMINIGVVLKIPE